MYFVYVLQSDLNNRLYVGYTTDIKRRIAIHNKRKVSSTKHYAPWRLIFTETYTNKEDALRKEKYFKTTVGKRALKIMLKETLRST